MAEEQTTMQPGAQIGDAVLTPANTTITPDQISKPNQLDTHGLQDKRLLDGLEAAVAKDAAAAKEAKGQPSEQPKGDEPTPKAKAKAAAKPSINDAFKSLEAPESPTTQSQGENAEAPSLDDIPKDYQKGTKAEQWAALHKAKDDALHRAVEAEERIKQVRSELTDMTQMEVQEIKAERDKLAKELERVAIERSPEFNKEFSARQEGILRNLKSTLKPSDYDRVENLMKAEPTDARLKELEGVMESLSPLKQRQFADMVSDFDRLRDERQMKIQQSMENWEAESANRTQKQREIIDQELAKFDRETNRWRDVLANTENESFNQEVSKALDNARSYMTSDLSSDDLGKVVRWGAIAPALQNLAMQQAQKINELQTKLDQIEKASPDYSRSAQGEGDEGRRRNTREEIQRHGDMGAAIIAKMKRDGVLQGDILR